jgi:plasmid stability protein
MPRSIAVAIVRDEPPEVFVAEDQETLNWVLALRLIAATPGGDLEADLRDRLRQALREERWGDAVEMWISARAIVDVYPSHPLHTEHDVELAAQELEFSPLFTD